MPRIPPSCSPPPPQDPTAAAGTHRRRIPPTSVGGAFHTLPTHPPPEQQSHRRSRWFVHTQPTDAFEGRLGIKNHRLRRWDYFAAVCVVGCVGNFHRLCRWGSESGCAECRSASMGSDSGCAESDHVGDSEALQRMSVDNVGGLQKRSLIKP